MLTREAAEEALKKHRNKAFLDQRVARLAGLSEAARPNARTLLQLQDERKTVRHWQEIREQQEKALAALAALSEAELESMIRTMFPELATYMLRALANMARQPYMKGHGRKPFRAPRSPNLLLEQRLAFLSSIFGELGEYPPDVEWIAAWHPHAWSYRGMFVVPLLAAAMDENDAKGQKVFDILIASAKGEHEVGQMSRALIAAFLLSERREGWEFVEKLLVAAQREEGLRQSILESVDQGHPEAFRRFLRVVLEHDLARFSATVRAVDVWFGFMWDAMSARKAQQIMELAAKFLDDEAAADAAIAAAKALPAPAATKTKGKKLKDPEEEIEPAYIALWTKAFADVQTALGPAEELAEAVHPESRFAAVHLLGQLGLTGRAARKIAEHLDDPDERVAARALAHFPGGHYYGRRGEPPVADLFERLEKLFARTPEKTIKLAPIIWPWMGFEWGKERVGSSMVPALGKRPATKLIPHLEHLDPNARRAVVQLLGESKDWDDATRRTLFAMVRDPSGSVREEALKHLKKCQLDPGEAAGLEELLTRKSADVRRGLLTQLLSQGDQAALASADRLMESKNALQRVAGLEMLRVMSENKRQAESCRARAAAYREQHKVLAADEKVQLAALSGSGDKELTFDDCLGLIDPLRRTKPTQPQPRAVIYSTPAAIAVLKELDELIHQHREEPFTPVSHRGDPMESVLLGNAFWKFPTFHSDKPLDEQLEGLPFRELWTQWFEKRSAALRDADGLELLRAEWVQQVIVARDNSDGEKKEQDWLIAIRKVMFPGERIKLRYGLVVVRIIDWLQRIYPCAAAAQWLLDGMENGLALIPFEKLSASRKRQWGNDTEIIWRSASPPQMFCGLAVGCHEQFTPEQMVRLYGLLRWYDEPGVPIERSRPDVKIVLAARAAGGATDEDIYDFFLGPRVIARHHMNWELGSVCTLKASAMVQKHRALKPVLDRCRARVLEIELQRGETPTPVSEIAKHLRHSGGLDVLVSFLAATERDTFSRGRSWGSLSRPDVFSHIIRATFPAETDTPEAFAAAVRTAGLGEQRLLELAVYAPQWSEHVERALGWADLTEGVWWIHAHTRDRGWSVDQELRERWRAQIAQRTPLDAEDLLDGAVDVAWFKRVRDGLGKKRWEALYDLARFAASGGGHTRAQLFADAMLGQVKGGELIGRISTKRHQDSVRALGLVPLGQEQEKRKKELQARYKVLQEFVRTSRQFGSMRQASERRSAAIGTENLARTAGYPDPVRLQWAMEAAASADLAKGPVTAVVGEVTVQLALDDDGMPELTCQKKGKSLASIPPAVKKDAKVAELAERKTDLRRSASRMKSSLEQAMVRGDLFTPADLIDLMSNPLLAPLLCRLVFIGEGIAGYPDGGGRGLRNSGGKIEPIKKNESLRLAHPRDFLDAGNWSDWQRDCFAAERVQPFKQIFRELYVATKTEMDAANVSRRYAGHQVQPRQALALLGGRGWITAPEEGVFRTFHEAKVTAWLTFQESFFTPADIEGLTLGGVYFTTKAADGGMRLLGVKEIEQRMFSEVMRDLDLVVSVAHRGGVDPEASASTVEMRTSLLQETLHLLAIKNVRIKDRHAFIKGALGEYTVHLGSAVTHRQPGGALFIVAVHSQHRGRLFLPFADDDPKSAEVISKVLLLARDAEIKDPNLLAQIRGV